MHGRRRQGEANVIDEQGDSGDQLMCSRQWDKLHQSLLEKIQQRLPLADYVRFSAVCQSWLEVRRDNRSTSYLGSKVPWLMLFKVPCNTPVFYSLSENRVYRIPRMEPVLVGGHCVVASSFGWLLFNRTEEEGVIFEGEIPDYYFRFFLHPISGVKIHLPIYKGEWNRDLVAMSSPLSDPNCVIAVPRSKGFALCRIGDLVPRWRICNPSPFSGSEEDDDYEEDDDDQDYIWDVAFYDGRFYGLTIGADIVIVDWETAEIQKLNMDCRRLPERRIGSHTSFLASARGFFLLKAWDKNLHMGIDCPPDVRIQVFKAEFNSMTWVRVRSLGEQQVFMSVCGSILLDSSTSCHRGDVIYFSHPASWCYLDCEYRSPQNKWCLLEHDLKNGTTRYYQHPVGTGQSSILGLAWVSPSLV